MSRRSRCRDTKVYARSSERSGAKYHLGVLAALAPSGHPDGMAGIMRGATPSMEPEAAEAGAAGWPFGGGNPVGGGSVAGRETWSVQRSPSQKRRNASSQGSGYQPAGECASSFIELRRSHRVDRRPLVHKVTERLHAPSGTGGPCIVPGRRAGCAAWR
jgi:hypothetical protein